MNRSACLCGKTWAKYGLLAALVAAGGAGGLYLSGGWPMPTGPVAPPEPTGPFLPHRFPLSSFDAKETKDAAEVAIDAADRVYLVWPSQTTADENTLFLVRSDDGGRSFGRVNAVARSGIFRPAASTKGKPTSWPVKMAPHVATDGGNLHLAWTEMLPDRTGVRMVLATSTDAGVTFDPPRPVHQGGNARPTYTALAVGSDGTLACSWLDNRARSQQTFASVRPAGTAEFVAERLVHAGQTGRGVCPCCPTASLVAPDGTLYVAFRNLRDGYRDIAIGRMKPGQAEFEGPFPGVPPAWKFDGCPHDGPSLALVGDTLHVVWMDARTGSPRCYYARAKTAGMKFEARELHPIETGSQGNPKLVADATGGLYAVWEESRTAIPDDPHAHHPEPAQPTPGAGGGRSILVAHLPAGGVAFGPVREAAAVPDAFQTRPAIALLPGGDLVVAWNELDPSGKAVVVARLSREGRP